MLDTLAIIKHIKKLFRYSVLDSDKIPFTMFLNGPWLPHGGLKEIS